MGSGGIAVGHARTLRISGEVWIYIGIRLDRRCSSGWTSRLQHWSKSVPAQHLRYHVPKDKSFLQHLPANVFASQGPNWPQWEFDPAPRTCRLFHLASLSVQALQVVERPAQQPYIARPYMITSSSTLSNEPEFTLHFYTHQAYYVVLGVW